MAKVEVSAEDLQLILDNTRVTAIDGKEVYRAIEWCRSVLYWSTRQPPARPTPLADASAAMMSTDLSLLAVARLEADVVRYRQESRDWQRKCLDAQEALSQWRKAQETGGAGF